MNKILLLIQLYFLLLTVATAQSKAPEQATAPVKLFFEKPYLHTDRENYAAGENLWFKAYLVNARTNQPIETSRNLYVELISPYSEIINRSAIRLDKGTGAGDFQLSDSIPNGTYRIRAYTNWMRNFGDSFVFEKDLTIHSLHKTTAEVMAMVSAAPAKASLELSATNPYVRVAPAEQIQFFPEGGALVSGVASVVAFKAEDATGTGVKVKGSVYTSEGDTLSRFESNVLGMGSFSLLPVAGVIYYIKGKFEETRPFKATLPAAHAGGFALRTTDADSATLLVTVSTNEVSLQAQQGREFLLVGRHGNERKLTVPFTLNALQTSFRVAKAMLPPGLATITLYDEALKPHGERLVYIPQREQTTITITPDQATYPSKSKVTVRIKATGKDDVPVRANLSVAAVDASVVPANEVDIASYLLLQSEIKGKIQQPGQYFDERNKDRFRQLDLLLLTQGWRDFVWKKMADSTYIIKYLPEQGFTVSGRVRQLFVDKPLPEANITLTAFRAKGQKLYATKTNAEGRFYFDGLQLHGRQTITINAVNNKGKKAGELYIDSLLTEPLPLRPVPLLLTPISDEFAAAQVEIMRRKATMRRYSLSDTILLREVEVKTSKVTRLQDGTGAVKSGRPDRVYEISKQDHAFETLRRFIDYHIPEDRQKEGSVRFFVNNWEIPLEPNLGVEQVENMQQEGDVRNQHFRETIYSLSMKDVKKLVLRQLVGIDGKAFFILYIDTTPGAFDKKEFNRAIAGVHGYYESRVFYSPQYNTRDNPAVPDVRTTLFWKHTVLTDENGEATVTYYNADPAAKIRIVAEGLTERGEALVGTAAYEVK